MQVIVPEAEVPDSPVAEPHEAADDKSALDVMYAVTDETDPASVAE